MNVTSSEGTDEGVSESPADTDQVEATGHFRICLGAAPGVGKTYAMLCEGQRRRGRGADIVVGFVEAHGRPLTEEMINGLEVIPRTPVDYRGCRLEEMDLDAVLRRRPPIALIDELAHTNVPGSGPNAKRWQDVLDILGAGINVITTVNIQHLESIADEVEQMTGARVRERVPDWVVRKANQIAAPGTDVLLRRAARIASRVKGELDVVHGIIGDTSLSGNGPVDRPDARADGRPRRPLARDRR